MPLEIVNQRVPPTRALVLAQNSRGKPFSATDMNRWIRLNRMLYGTEKVDVLTRGAFLPDFQVAVDYARLLDVRVSLRTDCVEGPPAHETLSRYGFHDLFVSPSPKATYFDAWVDACTELGLEFRVQLPPVWQNDAPERLGARLAGAGAVAATFMASDPFSTRHACSDGSESKKALEWTMRTAEVLRSHEVDVSFYGFPDCVVPEGLKGFGGPGFLYFDDHQQYAKPSYDLALSLDSKPIFVASKILMVLVARHGSAKNPVDELFLEWLFLKHRFVLFWTLFFRKTLGDLRREGGSPNPFKAPSDKELFQWEDTLTGYDTESEMRRFQTSFPGVACGMDDWKVNPAWYRQPKYYDPLDRSRTATEEGQIELARCANEVMTNRPPDRTIGVDGYAPQNTFHEPLSSANRWLSISRSEKLTNRLGTFDGAFTVAVTFGGGRAQWIGFALRRHGQLLCSMTESAHRIALHVEPDGRCVLLRDGEPVRPVESPKRYYVPRRLLFPVDLRITAWNIDGEISSQAIDFWEGEGSGLPSPEGVKYSVVIFCTRFARRLQHVLLSLVHQVGVESKELEIIVGYVPGADTTDDTIDSFRLLYPEVRIQRVPFPRTNMRSKGLVINQCCAGAAGEWVLLLDSDILLPPNMIGRIEAAPDEMVFMCPEGRRMLDPNQTARVLLSDLRPWEDWDTLMAKATVDKSGEAEGIPIGYCQIVRRSCLDEVQYTEYEHFEGADSDFALAIRERYGNEHRMDGVSVLHLDHGGSQWYGTDKQR